MQVYCATNTANGKKYVGLTTTSLADRWKAHVSAATTKRDRSCRALAAAIRKYGREAFVLEVLDTAETHEELAKKEEKWIEFFGTMTPNGYNLRTGGELGYRYSEESIERNRKAHLGKKHRPETIEKLRSISAGDKNPFFGRKHDEATKQKMKVKQAAWRSKTENAERLKDAVKVANQKTFSVVSPDGQIFEGLNLNQFCKERGLDQGNMQKVVSGKYRQCKGWTRLNLQGQE